MRSLTTALCVLGAAITSVHALSKVTRTGRYLYTEDGNRFSIKGIAYQEQGVVVAGDGNDFGEPSTFVDPLADSAACARDLPFLKELGVNALRVYSVDSRLNHDSCMAALEGAGIYTIIDLALPLNGSIDRLNPAWSTNVLNQYLATIDTFSKYTNVLAYNIGNEVVVQTGTPASPYVKAAARDVKAYLTSKNDKTLVAYAAINGASGWRDALANYLSCDPAGGNSGASSIDLYGLNDYTWCGESSFEKSYKGTHDEFANYNVAAYLSEFGCVSGTPRLWTETQSLFSSQMSDVWSGGLAFSYFPASSAAGQFGMVTVSTDGKTVTTSDDFAKLKTQYGTVTLPTTPAKGSAGPETHDACPAANDVFLASTTLPPTPNAPACDCLVKQLSCQFTPPTSDYSAIAGTLLDTGCSLLGAQGANCSAISGSGQTGVYGAVASCDPQIKTAYVMSQFFELNDKNPDSCRFAGNGTINPSTTLSATAAASSCNSNPAATFAPSAVSSAKATGTSSTRPSTSGTSAAGNNAVALLSDSRALVGMGAVIVAALFSATFTLV